MSSPVHRDLLGFAVVLTAVLLAFYNDVQPRQWGLLNPQSMPHEPEQDSESIAAAAAHRERLKAERRAERELAEKDAARKEGSEKAEAARKLQAEREELAEKDEARRREAGKKAAEEVERKRAEAEKVPGVALLRLGSVLWVAGGAWRGIRAVGQKPGRFHRLE